MSASPPEFCTQCGALLGLGVRFCEGCGCRVEVPGPDLGHGAGSAKLPQVAPALSGHAAGASLGANGGSRWGDERLIGQMPCAWQTGEKGLFGGAKSRQGNLIINPQRLIFVCETDHVRIDVCGEPSRSFVAFRASGEIALHWLQHALGPGRVVLSNMELIPS